MSEVDLRFRLSRDRLLLWRVVSECISIFDFIPFEERNVFCVFHKDVNKPSAVCYEGDEDGIDKLWCFKCSKHYTSFDYIKRILGRDPLEYLFLKCPVLKIKASVNHAEVFVNTVAEERLERLEQFWVQSKGDTVAFLNSIYNVG